jgi:uncharacterized protein
MTVMHQPQTTKPSPAAKHSSHAPIELSPEQLILQERIGRFHLRQRLGIEMANEPKVFGQGRSFFHIENWTSAPNLIKTFLRLSFLHKRGQRNARIIKTIHNDIILPNLPKNLDGFRLLHLSDAHLDMHEDVPHALIEAVRKVDYDICVWTGDFRSLTYGPCDAVLSALERVRTHLKKSIYAVLGNHDSIRMVPAMEQLGIRLLLNENIKIEHNDAAFYLAGIDDPHYFRTDNFEKAAQDIPEDAVSILLAHSPEIYQQCAFADFNLMLCGHTHGGQICLPGGKPITLNARCPRYVGSGNWRYQQLRGYTSAGSGTSVVDARFNCPPEITVHRLRCA